MRLLRKILLMTPALLLLAVSLPACSKPQEERFPSFVYSTAGSLESYRAASSLPRDVMTSIPCYCGCAAAPSDHKILLDCFYDKDGNYTDHASGCDICGKIALDVQAKHRQGMSLKEIRAFIDSKYSIYGKATNTPPVEK